MSKFVKSLSIYTVVFTFSLVSTVAKATLAEIVISGNTSETTGDLVYVDGGTFTASFIFDTSFVDTNLDSNIGNFNDFSGGSALISFGVTTSIGTISFKTADLSGTSVSGPQVSQIQIPVTSQDVTVTSPAIDLSQIPGNGFNGSFVDTNGLTLSPDAFALELLGLGANNYFFSNPNELFSGLDNLSTDASLLGGTIHFSDFGSALTETTVGFSATEFNINQLNPVPVPAAAWLFGSGLLGLFNLMRYRSTQYPS